MRFPVYLRSADILGVIGHFSRVPKGDHITLRMAVGIGLWVKVGQLIVAMVFAAIALTLKWMLSLSGLRKACNNDTAFP